MSTELRLRLRASKLRAARVSVISTASLTLVKLVTGALIGSISVLSEAIHSATDLVAAIIAYFSVRASDSPPDDDHPYGHGKIESVSALAEAMLIFGSAIYILYEVIDRLRNPHPPHINLLNAGIVVMLLSMIVNTVVSRFLARVARETESQALSADAAHIGTDAGTSTGVLVGLILARATGRAWLDPAIAGLVATLLIAIAFRLLKDALNLLLDIRLPEIEEARIRTIIESDQRVRGHHKLRTRKSGSVRHADVHVLLDDELTLLAAHSACEELEDAIRAAFPGVIVNIHIEPYQYEINHQREVHGVEGDTPGEGR